MKESVKWKIIGLSAMMIAMAALVSGCPIIVAPTPTPTAVSPSASSTSTPDPSATPSPAATPSPTPAPTPTPVSDRGVYADSLASGWVDWSWNATVNYSATAPAHSGARSIAVTMTLAESGLQIHSSPPVDGNLYSDIEFWINGGASGGQNLSLILASESDSRGSVAIAAPSADAWTKVSVPLSSYSPASFDNIIIRNDSGAAPPAFYVDDIVLIGKAVAPTPSPVPTIALSVDAALDNHAISPYIYGMNFASADLAADIGLSVDRWGGKYSSRYNYATNMWNYGRDWFFENAPATASADDFVAQDRTTGTKSIITIPMIGWIPKSSSPTSHPFDAGFKVSKYGAQQSFDTWDTDCGNGVDSGGVNITGNDPMDTSVAVTAAWATSWINHLTSLYGTAASGGVKFYGLDNEPSLWNSTHRDVHPLPVGYDELWNTSSAYAAAIKAADPTALTLGPSEYGWLGYFYSAIDAGSPGADRAAHGDVDLTPWYLSQMRAYETAHGVRLLDYLDLHIYPQGSGINSASAGDAATQAERLRSTRQLWDPTYHDDSWIWNDLGASIHLIPRMRQWVADNYPGTKLSISEYSWGAMGSLNGALAQADLLGIFGREGLDMATLWGPPTSSQPGAYAFRVYRNYDGSHHGFGETSIRSASEDQDRLAVYGSLRASDGAMTLVLINKTSGPVSGAVSISGFSPAPSASVYRYSGDDLASIAHCPDIAVSSNAVSAACPANSITLLVIPHS